MRRRPVPVTMGSPRFRSLDTGGFLVTEAWFPPGAVLEPHTHERAIFAVMLRGSFDSRIARRRLECVPGSVWTEPREERHANYIGPAGARVLVVQPDPAREDLSGAADARRVLAEFGHADSLSGLAVEALAVGMMAVAARLTFGRRRAPVPPWLDRARDMVHAHFRERIHLSELAAAVGVQPSHLAHAFRAHFGTAVGAYVRALRIEWAAERLVSSDMPLSEIAAHAGYSDQSHFTRECRRRFGVGPAEYRRLTRGR
jgi:AraC family transcriptional regulator